jgi:signal transduction histidine kinase/ActR/RegA family two-component response regulator
MQNTRTMACTNKAESIMNALDHTTKPVSFAKQSLLLATLFLGLGLVQTALASKSTNILIIHSYSQEYDWTKRQHQGFVAALSQDPLNTPVISTEYLDTKRVTYRDDYAKTFDGILAQKYSNYQPDLIYVSDDNAMQFALTYLQKRYPQVPLFFSGINDFTLLNKIDKSTTTGTFEKKDIATNLTLIKQLSLAHNPIILLGDNSSTDKAIAQEAKSELLQYEDINASIISFECFDDALNAIKQHPDATIILTTIGGWKDKQNQPIPLAQSIHAINALNNPVIAMEDAYIFDGVLGGYVTSGESQGSHTGKMAKAYLMGIAISNIPPILTSPNEFILDANSFQKQSLQIPTELSEQAILLNPQQRFYEREKPLIIASIYTLIGLLLISSALTVRTLSRKNKALKIAQTQTEAASQAKSEFLGSMSHELRTPLNAILGFAQLINLESDENQEINDFSQEIERAGSHLLSLVNDLIDLSRIESGKLEITLEPILLSNLEKDCLSLIAPLAEKFQIHLSSQSAFNDIIILADALRLRQIIINFLSNGIKYNKPNGSVSLQTIIMGNSVRIQVADTGVGIAEDKQNRIFNAFDRLGAECGTIEGTGIGLVIAKRLIEAMNGSIGFSSISNQGSRFWVDFPIYQQQTTSQRDVTQRPSTETTQVTPVKTPTSQTTILCIEDNPVNLKLIQKILAKNGNYLIYEATTAMRGIDIARREQPNLILSDINLPDMDGYQVLSLLKADPKTQHIPIIALTADAMKEDIDRGEKAGFAGYITKPIDIPALFLLIERLLKTQQTLDN